MKYKPFESKGVNRISIINEVAVSIYLYTAFLLSDYLDSQMPDDDQSRKSELRLTFAWILTGIMILTIFVNFIYALNRIVPAAISYLNRKMSCTKESARKYEVQ
jgi:hypothetical protein